MAVACRPINRSVNRPRRLWGPFPLHQLQTRCEILDMPKHRRKHNFGDSGSIPRARYVPIGKELLRSNANNWLTMPLFDGRRARFANNRCIWNRQPAQSSAIYFKRHKASKRRAALFRQLRATSTPEPPNVKQQAFDNASIAQGLRSEQLWLRGSGS